MRRNRFVKRKKRRIEGRWIFLIVGLLITTVMFIYAQVKDSDPQYSYIFEETSNNVSDYEESKAAQIGSMEKSIQTPKIMNLGMGARCAKLDAENEEILSVFSEEEIILLQKITFAESRGESIEGQIGVINVILNRIENEEFPDTVNDVVFDNRYDIRQFTPAHDEEIWFCDEFGQYRTVLSNDIIPKVKEAVERAISGENTVGKRKYFCTAGGKADNEPDALIIDNLVFYGEN